MTTSKVFDSTKLRCMKLTNGASWRIFGLWTKMTSDDMVKYFWRTGDASPWSNKKRIGEIDWFLTEKSLISGPAILLIIMRVKNSNAPANFEMSLNHQDQGVWRSGWHPRIQELKDFILRPFPWILLLYFQNRTPKTLTDIKSSVWNWLKFFAYESIRPLYVRHAFIWLQCMYRVQHDWSMIIGQDMHTQY